MLLAQTASQLDKQVSDEFLRVLFPSGAVSGKMLARQTATELNLATTKLESQPPVNPSQPENSLPIGTLPPFEPAMSRQHRRYNEKVRERLDKRYEKQEEKSKARKQQELEKLQAIRNKVKEDERKNIPERIKRIIGI